MCKVSSQMMLSGVTPELSCLLVTSTSTHQTTVGSSVLTTETCYTAEGLCITSLGRLSKGQTELTTLHPSTIKLIGNFAAFIFSRMEIRKHNIFIDVIEHSGIKNTVKGLVSYAQSERLTHFSSGFISNFTQMAVSLKP